MRKKYRFVSGVIFAALLIILPLVLVYGGSDKEAKKPEGPVSLNVLWVQWDPSNAFAKVASRYEQETGGNVKVEMDFLAQDLWYQKWLAAAQAHEYVWDLVVLDSQWIGMGVDGGHVMDLTDDLKGKPFLQGIPEKTKQYYMADPTLSGKIWSVPLEVDAEILIYRKDLFNDSANKSAFKKKYGYDLQVPNTWAQLRDAAEFFYDPDNNFYGFITKWGKGYDAITWDFNQVLWAFGGAFWDPKTRTAEGYINSPKSVKAMEFYKELAQFAPPGWPEAMFDTTVQSMNQGLVAMAIEWSSFSPSIVDPNDSKVYDKVGFTVVPEGPAGRFVSLGGQPLTISAYSPYQKEALDFIEWFYKEEQLWEFAENKGHPAFTKILNTDRFWKILPQNKALWESIPYVRDIWNIPPYNDLLMASQELLNDAARGSKPVKAALDELAARNQKTLDDFYK